MKRAVKRRWVLAWCLLLLGASSAKAAWIEDGVPLCTADAFQINPAMVPDGEGGAIVVWWDFRNDGEADLYAGRVDADGNAVWGADGVSICTQPGDQYGADIVSDGAGGAIIAWHDERGCNVCWDIYAQRIDADGVPLWAVDGVLVCGASAYQTYPRLVTDGQQGAIILWEDERGFVAKDIYAQRLDGDGNALWAVDGVPVCTAANVQDDAALVSDGQGGAWIVWQDARAGGSDYWDVYAQRVDADGVLSWTGTGLPVCTATGDQRWPGIVADGNGGAIVAWSDYRSGADCDIYAQRLRLPFGPIWPVNGVALCVATGSQYSPQLASDLQQGAILAWRDVRGTDMDVYAQRVTAGGTAAWPGDGVVICAAGGNQLGPRITSDGLGGAVVVWEDARAGVGAEDVYAQRVDSAGDTLWDLHGKALVHAPYGQRFPASAADGTGGAIVAWQDDRANGDWDIYAQSTTFIPATPDCTDASFADVWLVLVTGYEVYDYAIWLIPDGLGTITEMGDFHVGDPAGTYSVAADCGMTGTIWVEDGYVPFTGRIHDEATAELDIGDGPLQLVKVADIGALMGCWEGRFLQDVTGTRWDVTLNIGVDGVILASSGFPGPVEGRICTEAGHLAGRVAVGFPGAPQDVIVFQEASCAGNAVMSGDYDMDCVESCYGGTFELLRCGTTGLGNDAPARPAADLWCYPNPFNPRTTVSFDLRDPGPASLCVFDAAGRLVRVLRNRELLDRGRYEVVWDGRDAAGRSVPSGPYFFRLEGVGFGETRRATLIR